MQIALRVSSPRTIRREKVVGSPQVAKITTQLWLFAKLIKILMPTLDSEKRLSLWLIAIIKNLNQLLISLIYYTDNKERCGSHSSSLSSPRSPLSQKQSMYGTTR